jgi:hypothetical protein
MMEDTTTASSEAPIRDQNGPQRPRPGAPVIEAHQAQMSAPAADRLDALTKPEADPIGSAAAYLASVGNPAYLTAFGKMVMDPTSGHLRFSAEEVEAVRAVARSNEP